MCNFFDGNYELSRVMVPLMADEPDLDVPISFVRWLHAQAKSDPGRMMPYAGIYSWGRNIHTLLGSDGRFDAEFISLELAKEGATAEDLSALVSAEAAWRVDTLIERAETSGVSIDVGETDESTEIEPQDATVLCGFRNHRGEGCISPAIEGAGRCGRHGGAITDPEVRRSFLLVAFAKVIDGAQIAVETLLDVAENGRSDMARVQAAKELLDRAGVQQDQHVHIHRPDEDVSEDELIAELQRKLSTATDRLRIAAIPMESESTVAENAALSLAEKSTAIEVYAEVHTPDDDIVDAVLVGDDV